MWGFGVVMALLLSLMGAVVGMQAASKGSDVHVRLGWSYFIRAPGKTRFRPVASANLIEDWKVCVKVKSIETALFVDRMAYMYGQQNRHFSYYTIKMSEQDADELLSPLIDTICNQYTRSNWGNFVGLSFLNMSDEQPGTVRINFYSLASNLFQNQHVLYSDKETFNGALKQDVKVLGKIEQHTGPLINAKRKARMNLRAWAAYVEELDGSNRSDEFFRAESIHGLKKLARILSYSAVEERPFRMIIEKTDRAQKSAYRKLEIECSPLDAYEMVSLILVAASNVDKIFDISPSFGIERILGFTFEPHGDKNVLIALHFSETERIDLDAVKIFVTRLLIADRLDSVIKSTSGDVQYAFPLRWTFMPALNGQLLTNAINQFSVEHFPLMVHQYIVQHADKCGFKMSFAPFNANPMQKGSMSFAIVMRIPSTNIRLLLVRIWADIMRNKQFSQHRHIERYTIKTLKDDGPYEVMAWLTTTKIRPEELKELRMIYAVFLRYIGIDGVDPIVALIQNNDMKTLRPYLDDPIDLSMIDFDSIKRAEWISVPANVDNKSDWISPKPAGKKNGSAISRKKSNGPRPNCPRASDKKADMSLEQAIEEVVAVIEEPTKPVEAKAAEPVKNIETVVRKPVQPTTKRSWIDVAAPPLRKEEAPVQVQAVEEEDEVGFPCVVPQVMEGCVHPKDLYKPTQPANTVDARIASLSSGQYTPSALISQTEATPAPQTPQGSLYTSSKLLWEGFTKRALSSESLKSSESIKSTDQKVPNIVVTPVQDDDPILDDDKIADHDDQISEETSESYDPYASDLADEESGHSEVHSDEHSEEAVIAITASPEEHPAEIDYDEVLPLNDQWAMYYIKPPYTIKKLSIEPINTVQLFWQYMNNMPYPAIGHSYAFWKNDGSPESSNPENIGGGRLRTQIKLNSRWTKVTGMDHWVHILVWMAANEDDRTIAKISGVVLKERIQGHFHIDVWYRKGFHYNDLQTFKRAIASINEEYKLKFTGEWKLDRFAKD